MPEVNVKVGDREYEIACGAGEEPHLRKAAATLDAEAARIVASGQNLPETTLLLMSGLLVADRAGDTATPNQDDSKIKALEAELNASKEEREALKAQVEAAKAAAEQSSEAQTSEVVSSLEAELATAREERDKALEDAASLKAKLTIAEDEPAQVNGEHAVLERMALELERLADEMEAGAPRLN